MFPKTYGFFVVLLWLSAAFSVASSNERECKYSALGENPVLSVSKKLFPSNLRFHFCRSVRFPGNCSTYLGHRERAHFLPRISLDANFHIRARRTFRSAAQLLAETKNKNKKPKRQQQQSEYIFRSDFVW